MVAEFQECTLGGKPALLPVRATRGSAGYDFFASEDVVIPSILKQVLGLLIGRPIKPKRVYTNVKVKLNPYQTLLVFNRSSNPSRGLVLANGVGVVDSDYYGNPNNDGNIGFEFYNLCPWDVTIKRGTRIGQGVITFFSLAHGDELTKGKERTGGYGSTGE